MSRKILVVGGAGYIGGITCDILNNLGYDVTVYDNLLYEDRYLKPLGFVNGDIRDTKKVIECAKDCDVVVLMAALVGDAACAINPGLTEEINFKAIKNICKKLPKEKHIVFTSTCSIFGENENIVTEESPTKPLSCYASTKLSAEKYVLDRNGTTFRLGTIFGSGDFHSRIRADLVVNTLTIKAFTEKKITVNGGNQWRPVIAAEDVGCFIAEASNTKNSGLFNLAHKNVKICDIADDILEVFPDIQVNRIEELFQDKRNYKVSNEKANKEFKHKANITVLDEIKRMSSLLIEGRIKNPNNILYNNGMYLSNIRI